MKNDMHITSRVTQLYSQQPMLPNFENCSMAPKCLNAKLSRHQNVLASKRIGAKIDRCQKVGTKIFCDETSRCQSIGAKTLPPKLWRQDADAKAPAPKLFNPTVLISEQIRGTKLVTEEKYLTNDIKL